MLCASRCNLRGLLAAALSLWPCAVPAEQVWARLDRPGEAQLVREPLGLVEVRGTAGTGQPGKHDVVLVLDRSGSTWRASGVDVDGDELVGDRVDIEPTPGRILSFLTDADDSIAQAQLQAARRLIERLDSETTRMGIVIFGGFERVLADVGTPIAELLALLEALPDRPVPYGTYFYGAIMAAIEALERAPSSQEQRQRSIVLLSDGLPNLPQPLATARKASVRAAQHAMRAGTRIYAFALGTEVARDPGVFRELTRANGGQLLLVENPGEIIEFVPHMSLTRLTHVEIENLSAKRKARAVRLFPDGSFDGFAPLIVGPNRLRITAYGQAGARAVIERNVSYEKIEADTDELRRRLRDLLEALRVRTLETQLAAEARRKRERVLERTLEIELER